MFFGVYLSVHTGSTGQPYMWEERQKEKLQMQECFWHRSNELSRKHWKEKVGNRRWRISGRKRAVSGQVASLISVLHQQPPQLFPQLPPSDEHWPLSAATPQRENWSRHRSAEHTEAEEFKWQASRSKTHRAHSKRGEWTHLWAAPRAHTQSSRRPPCWWRTPVANLMKSTCMRSQVRLRHSLRCQLKG